MSPPLIYVVDPYFQPSTSDFVLEYVSSACFFAADSAAVAFDVASLAAALIADDLAALAFSWAPDGVSFVEGSDWKGVVWGRSVDLGGRRMIKKNH